MELEIIKEFLPLIYIISGIVLDEIFRLKIRKENERKEFHEMWKQEQYSGRNHYKNNYKNNKNN